MRAVFLPIIFIVAYLFLPLHANNGLADICKIVPTLCNIGKTLLTPQIIRNPFEKKPTTKRSTTRRTTTSTTTTTTTTTKTTTTTTRTMTTTSVLTTNNMDEIQIDNNFITSSELRSKYGFHFSRSASNTWVAARDYCNKFGSYLLEVDSEPISNFIKAIVHKKGYTQNWWMGLRKTDGCRCMNVHTLKTIPPNFVSQFEFDYDQTVSMNCGLGVQKICGDGSEPWYWVTSGNTLSTSSNWHKSGPTRHNCAILRFDTDLSWGKQNCSASRGANRALISPLCVKSLQAPTKADSNKPLQDMTQCFDLDVLYRGKIIRRSLKHVPNARRCSAICRLVKKCRYWTWRGDFITRRCILKKSLRKKKFRYRLIGAVSGKILSCRTSKSDSKGPCYKSYNTELIKSEIIATIKGRFTSQDCLNKCKSLSPLCRSFSWFKDAGKYKCILSASIAEDEGRAFSYRVGGITGVYSRNECFQNSEDKSKCSCKSFDYDYYDDLRSEDIHEGIAKGCTPLREFAYCPISDSNKKLDDLKLKEKEVCIEIGVDYLGGRIIGEHPSIKSAILCRILCTDKCAYWSWTKDSFKCTLRSALRISKERFPYSVSGSTTGICSTKVSISKLTKCGCLPLDDIERGERIRSGQSIYMEMHNDEQDFSPCSEGLLLKCGRELSVQKFSPGRIF